MDASTRARIAELFEKHRAAPGATYDEDHFLDFLLANPKEKRAVFNSFRGLHRFNAFLDEVQYVFGICFSLEDRDANYPLDKFVDRVIQLQRSRRGSLIALNNQLRAGAEWQVLVVTDFILLLAAVSFRNSIWALVAVGTIAITVNIWFFWSAWKARAYLFRLRARIEQGG